MLRHHATLQKGNVIMKKTLLFLAAAGMIAAFTACNEQKPEPATAPAPAAASEPAVAPAKSDKPVGVPTKVHKQIKGIEQQNNDRIQQELDNM